MAILIVLGKPYPHFNHKQLACFLVFIELLHPASCNIYATDGVCGLVCV